MVAAQAVHLINKLPTPVLQHKSPHEVLYKELPGYDHLRVFGCLAFAYNPSPPTDNFEHRGMPCIFLGYPLGQKAYRLMNLMTKQEFTSRDVLFRESIFPFHWDSSIKYMQPIPPSMPDLSDDFYDNDSELNLPGSPPITSPVVSSSTSPSTTSSPASVSPVTVRRSSRPHTKPQWFQDFDANYTTHSISNLAFTAIDTSFNCFFSTVTTQQDPVSFNLL
ncbi:hypothetical protein AgCh_028189 [Apium graveolens]